MAFTFNQFKAQINALQNAASQTVQEKTPEGLKQATVKAKEATVNASKTFVDVTAKASKVTGKALYNYSPATNKKVDSFVNQFTDRMEALEFKVFHQDVCLRVLAGGGKVLPTEEETWALFQELENEEETVEEVVEEEVDYGELEKEHLGDEEEGTGIYHPDNQPEEETVEEVVQEEVQEEEEEIEEPEVIIEEPNPFAGIKRGPLKGTVI